MTETTAWSIGTLDAARLCMEGDMQRREAEHAADLAFSERTVADPWIAVKGRPKYRHKADYPDALCWLEGVVR